jgi:hypothetical protein
MDSSSETVLGDGCPSNPELGPALGVQHGPTFGDILVLVGLGKRSAHRTGGDPACLGILATQPHLVNVTHMLRYYFRHLVLLLS